MEQPRGETSDSDGELVRKALDGHPDLYAELVRRWSGRILAICHARIRRSHVAEDLAQETLLRGLSGLGTLDSPEKFGPWLCGIANRVCLDWLKSKQTSQVPFTELSSQGHPDGLLVAVENSREVERADELRRLMQEVESLSDEHREVLMLYYYNDMTYRDLADFMGVSMATINARLTQARARLRKRLSESRRESDE